MAEDSAITELLPKVRDLPKADKLGLMQFLVFELAREEDISLLQTEGDYPIWTSYNAFDAAATLLDALKEEQVSYAGGGTSFIPSPVEAHNRHRTPEASKGGDDG